MAKVIELLKQYIEERKIDMKKWQLCIGFGYEREEAVAFQKQILSELGGIITEADCPTVSDWSNNFSSYRSVSDWRWIYQKADALLIK